MRTKSAVNAAALYIVCAFLLPEVASSYEIATHALVTQRSFSRSELASSGVGSLQERLGLDRLDLDQPFSARFTTPANGYYDNAPADTLSPTYFRELTPHERDVFAKLIERGYLSAPPTAQGSTAQERFERTLLSWLLRGAIREDDIPLQGQDRDIDLWGEKVRVTRHFYDPVGDRAAPGFGDAKAIDWAMGEISALSPVPDEDTSRLNHFSWRDARNNLYWALKQFGVFYATRRNLDAGVR